MIGMMAPAPTIDDWHRLRVVIGTVLRAERNETARYPAYRLWIDFGPLGEKQSSAKLTQFYSPSDLVGRQVVAVTGFDPMRIGGFRSDVLVLGGMLDGGAVALLTVDRAVPPGTEVS